MVGSLDTGVLTLLGLAVFGGILGASIFQRLRVPQVVGYIVIGCLIGESGFKWVGAETVARLEPVNLFALGIIGFLVGGELLFAEFRKHIRQLLAILLGEGLAAFVLVGLGTGAVIYVLSGDWAAAAAVGIVLGAISSATDPASTLSVLWECRARGVLTSTLIAIVALDDALAMTLYGLGTGAAQVLTGTGGSVMEEVARVVQELVGAVAVGAAAGFLTNALLMRMQQKDKIFALTVGVITLVIGVAASYGMDAILATMTLGIVLINLAPRRSRELFETVRAFAAPIYVLFFVLVGARLGVGNMPGWLWLIVAIYVIGRTAGKIGGTYLGARISGAAAPVRRYAGAGLFAQGGVTVGLSIMASHHLGAIEIADGMNLGDIVVFGVTATTLAVQLAGPPLIKLCTIWAGEAGRDVKEEDIINAWTVGNAMTGHLEPISARTPLSRVFDLVSSQGHLVYPVVDDEQRVVGVITLESLMNIFGDRDTWPWIVAADVMNPATDTVHVSTPLAEATRTMAQLGLEEMPVLNGENRAAGILDARTIKKRVAEEVMRRRQAAE